VRGAGIALIGAWLLLAAPTVAQATTITISVFEVESFDEAGSSLNAILWVPVELDQTLVSVSWNVSLEAFEPSWLSEMSVTISNEAGDQISFAPAVLNEFSGSESYIGGINLDAVGLSFGVRSGSLLRVEFWESFDDSQNQADGRWKSGALQFTFSASPIPEPTALATLALGIAMIWLKFRRRENQTTQDGV